MVEDVQMYENGVCYLLKLHTYRPLTELTIYSTCYHERGIT